jgi:endonuclease/exonuclease/phosphatase family metal-dependent hydrolase
MHMPLPGAGYILGNKDVLPDIVSFIKSVDPDIVGLIEVDTGSIRSRKINQAETIATELGMNSSYETKYGARSLNQLVPIIRKQGNAFLAAPRVHGETFHYFDTGIKRLIIELEMETFAVFLVHLSLKYRHRHLQLRKLYDLIAETSKPVIVAGDFNTFWGENEIAQRESEKPAVLSESRAAQGTRFCPLSGGCNGDEFRNSRSPALRSPAAGL